MKHTVLKSGSTIEVKSAAEILATLDADGRLDGIPFMPEMTAFLGRRFTVHRQAEKTCVEGGGLRSIDDVVLLAGARCDGAAHDGCQRGCMIFWKESWLRPAEAATPAIDLTHEMRARETLAGLPTMRGEAYACQSTALLDATRAIGRLSLGHLARDMARGDLSIAGFAAISWRTLVNLGRRKLGMAELDMLVGEGRGRPAVPLNLEPGEWVRVRPLEEIRPTLDASSKSAGLSFEPEMTRYAGKVFQVQGRVDRIIHEETHRMVRLKNTVTLCDLVCRGTCVKNCPRANPLYWREAWLERVEAPAGAVERTAA